MRFCVSLCLWCLLCVSALADTPRIYEYQHKPGTLRLVNWWAVWCEACKTELKEFATSLPGNANLVLIDEDVNPTTGEQWLKENLKGASYTLVADPKHEIADHYKLTSFPTSYVVDEKDHIIFEQDGYQEGKSTQALVNALKR